MKCDDCQLKTVCDECGKQICVPTDTGLACKLKDYWTTKKRDFLTGAQIGEMSLICYECEEKKWR